MKERLYERKRVLVDKITTEMEVKGPSSQLEALLAQVLNSDLSIIPEYEQCFEEISTPIVRVPAGHIVDAIGLMLRASTIPNKPELKEDEKKVCVKFKDFQREANNSVCAICLEKYEQEDEIEIRHCSHTFHKKCLKPWENSNRSNGKRCPCCRQ
jgi:hypothetical protein